MNKLTAKARITEVDGLSDSVIRIFGADTKAQEDTFLKGQIAELTTLSDAITAAILQDKAVSNLDEADSRRDEAVRNLGALLSGYAESGILSASYVSESSMIESMLGDFTAAEAKANIEKLDGVAEMVSAIRTAQDNFTAANDAFVKAEGSKGASASSYKKPILAIINDKIVPYLNTMAIVGNTAVADFAKGVESEISRVNETVAKRGK